MALPIDIHKLLNGRVVEWERLELKRGWNPEDIIHSMCAFAKHNWGGGYIVVGIEAEDGVAIMPPTGLPQHQLDIIQSKALELGNKIQPAYFPVMQPYEIDGKHILVLWCPAGDYRPYSAPSTLGEKSQRQYFVRVGSNSIAAKEENLNRMFELAARVPFDDRINQQANIDDFDLALIQQYLHEVKSDLYEESKKISLPELVRNMHIAKGSEESLLPVNVGLMFFTNEPEKYFPRTWIEVVWHKNYDGDNFTEHYFKGALHIQLRNALSFIKENMIHEQVRKIPGQAEAKRFYNYPYEAIEEALANAVYHKGYDLGKPIEVQIFPDKITILSFPGAMPPVDYQILHNQKIIARDYRNRRIGDFLKELDLTEGRGTGFPIMFRKLKNNNSPEPIIETDAQGRYFLITIPVNPEWVEEQEETNNSAEETIQEIDQKIDQKIDDIDIQIIHLFDENPYYSISDISKKINRSITPVKKRIDKLKSRGILERIGADKGGYWKINR
jgi:ATP-dependent DNA helicase RecG